jgi:hypothetical protein
MFRRRCAWNMIAEQRPEAWSRLNPRVPIPRWAMVVPWHVSEIIDAGQMRCRGNIGKCELVTGNPTALFGQIADTRFVVTSL